MPRIDTPRLALIPATPHTLRAELEGRASFSRVLGIDVSPEWPPELYDDDATRWVLRALEENPAYTDWGMYYLARARDDGTREVIGTGGFKGPPDDAGVVELGYAVLPAHRRRGYAREAVDGMLAWAFADPRVTRVIAHTLTELVPSIGVLQSAGFTFIGRGNDSEEPDAVRYDLTRDAYAKTVQRRTLARFPIPRD